MTGRGHAANGESLDRELSAGRVRILRRLDLPVGRCAGVDDADTSVGLVADVETNGLDVHRHRIIELSLRRFRYDREGVVTKLDAPFSWLEDPGEPLSPFISSLTGLQDADVRGRSIDERVATALLRSASVRICHNCVFDRPFIERRLRGATGLAWACSMSEVDWRGRGVDGGGRSLGWLLTQCGFFSDGAHRASADVDATIEILRHRSAEGRTALAELLETARRPSWRFAAHGAAYGDVTRVLKERGYRWTPDARVWRREVPEGERAAEADWLRENVYAASARPKAESPIVERVDWLTRHA